MKSVFRSTTFRFNKAGINEIRFQKECTEGVEVGFVLGEFKRTLLMHVEILLWQTKAAGPLEQSVDFWKLSGKEEIDINEPTHLNKWGGAQEHFNRRDWSLHYDEPNSRNPKASLLNHPSLLTVLMRMACVYVCTRTYVQLWSYRFILLHPENMRSIKTPVSFSFSNIFLCAIWIPLWNKKRFCV